MALSLDISSGMDAAYLERAIGRYLGLGRGTLTGDDKTDVEDVVNSGARAMFWHQYIEEGQTVPHVWSFLRREVTLSTVIGQSAYTTTETYRQLTGSVVIATGNSKGLMSVISDGDMRALLASDTDQAEPTYISILGNTISVHPIPDAVYDIKYPASKASTTIGLIPNDSVFSELLLVSCLAAADRMFNKETTANAERFQSLLQAAVKYDRQFTDVKTEPIWPDDTSEGLELNKKQLNRLVGIAKGFPADSDIWSVSQRSEVKELVKTGLRRFYNPIVLPGDSYPHEWSFMQPLWTLELEVGVTIYDLPDDFSMMSGPVVYSPDDNTFYSPISLIGENQLRRKLQYQFGQSRPVCCAYWPKEFCDTEGTRYEIGFSPEPDEAVEVTIRYKINPLTLSSDTSLPMGGPEHSQTIIEACLAAVEISSGKPGVHANEFEKLLIASVRHDQNASAPDFIDTDRDSPAYGYGFDNHVIGFGDITPE